MTPAYFNWTSPKEIRPALLRNSLGTVGKTKATIHLHELDRVGQELQASLMARENATRLATGYDDLVVVLLEPSDKAEWDKYDEMIASSKALQLVDETLKLAFAGQRGVDNTIILDRRPFRSAEIQNNENKEERKQNNQIAYRGFEATLAKLRPKVILICQCQDTAPDGRPSDQWSSSISKAGDHDLINLGNGHRCFCVYSFHPMYFEYIDGNDEPLKRVLSEYLFDATFVIAANLLVGRELFGFGLTNLKDCARHGPVPIICRNSTIWSYQWMTEKDCCSDDLWALCENASTF
ncbi:hypothetical protein K469DRAFT_261621 [Zopfia rhizophila CBS 207.26]|uniref:Uncharacterized protein n=1 Tax=Zopfia rhizophila CBS 207.26 TaxID=1314779 RepID=A0A6A6DQK7_9PEZI|nr:hypothetical protein K469DRAFT_261621 [Zopfia rhizophila CBS 207.26]